MHLYMMTRGQKQLVDRFINDLQAQYFDYKISPHEAPHKLQLGVRPIELWEIAFPKEELNKVLAMIGGGRIEVEDKRWGIKILAFILKFKSFFGLKDVPEIPKDINKSLIPFVYDGFVDRKLIGIKDDEETKVELV